MPYSCSKIQVVAYDLYNRYQHFFVVSVEVHWTAISVLDEIPLEWVKIWEEDSENLGPGESLEDIQEENRILHLGFAIEIVESEADEELNDERRRRVAEKELGDWREARALEEDEESDSENDSGDEEIKESKNGGKTEWPPSYAQQLGNDDEDWDKEAAQNWEALSIFEDFVDR